MHEGSLIKLIVGQVNDLAAAEGAVRVAVVRVRVGDLSHVSAGHLCQHFEFEARGTLSEGAALVITPIVGQDNPLSLEVILDSIELQMPETSEGTTVPAEDEVVGLRDAVDQVVARA